MCYVLNKINVVEKDFEGLKRRIRCIFDNKYDEDNEIKNFQKETGKMGYKFQVITLAGFHAQNYAVFDLARKYKNNGMTAYSTLQQQEFASESDGYTATKHQKEVGTTYFDAISNTISSGESSTTAMKDSTETEQF